MNISFFWTFNENFLVKVELFCAVILIQSIEICDIVRICVRIGKGKLNLLVLTLKMKLKIALQLAILPHQQWRLSGNSRPFRPFPIFIPIRSDALSVNRTVALWILRLYCSNFTYTAISVCTRLTANFPLVFLGNPYTLK